MSIEPHWLHTLVSTLARAAPDLVPRDPRTATTIVADAVTSTVPGCDACAVHFPVLRSAGRVDRPFTDTVGDPGLRAVLAAEGIARTGPVRAVVRDPGAATTYLADVATDLRWPEFGRALGGTPAGVGALVVVPVQVASRGVLLLRADRPHALDAATAHLGAVTDLVGLFLRLAWVEIRARHARDGVETGQVIGTATGMVMATQRVPEEAALNGLRATAQRSGRRLRDVATDVVDNNGEAVS